MAIDPQALLAHDFGEQKQEYVSRDAILYALGVGVPADPLDPHELRFVDERRLSVLPTFGVTLASPGMWIRDPKFGVDFSRLLHIAQDSSFHVPLPAAGEVAGTSRVASLTDRGEGRGAELVVERTIYDPVSRVRYCTLRQTLLLRGSGGFGGPPAARTAAPVLDRAPDHSTSVVVSPRAALIYRLSGDWNPLHIDPDFARSAGFDRPIMHGLGVYGAVAVSLCRTARMDPSELRSISCRFAGIVLPGDTLELSVWIDGSKMRFTAAVGGRTVLDQGYAAIGEDA